MSRSEANVLNDIMVALSQAGCIVWRNNTGQLPDATGRPIKFGLCIGSSDIIGICADGRFLAVECKSKTGRATEAQERFIAAVRKAGGRAGVARNVDDALRILID